MNENRDDEPQEEKEILESSYLVGAQQIEEGDGDEAGKWYGIFKLEENGVGFYSADVFDTRDEAIAWASEAGQAMLFNALIGLVAQQTKHWDD